MTFKGAELNYPIHEKELLAIIRALKKWHVDLLSSPFLIYMDHKTLENFNTQKDLSCCQALWMELMSQYDAKIVYIKGDDNCVADALSQLLTEDTLTEVESIAQHPYSYCSDEDDTLHAMATLHSDYLVHTPMEAANSLADGPILSSVNTVLNISADKHLLLQIRNGYSEDPWCKKLSSAMQSWPQLRFDNDLWDVGNCLIIPRTGSLHEMLFQLAHDVLGHFGFDKMYGSLFSAYYWPNMRRDLEKGYVASCPDCQHNKSLTSKPIGPLHPLPIPNQQGDSVAIDFIGPLPEDDSNDFIITFTDHLGSDIQLAAT